MSLLPRGEGGRVGEVEPLAVLPRAPGGSGPEVGDGAVDDLCVHHAATPGRVGALWGWGGVRAGWSTVQGRTYGGWRGRGRRRCSGCAGRRSRASALAVDPGARDTDRACTLALELEGQSESRSGGDGDDGCDEHPGAGDEGRGGPCGVNVVVEVVAGEPVAEVGFRRDELEPEPVAGGCGEVGVGLKLAHGIDSVAGVVGGAEPRDVEVGLYLTGRHDDLLPLPCDAVGAGDLGARKDGGDTLVGVDLPSGGHGPGSARAHGAARAGEEGVGDEVRGVDRTVGEHVECGDERGERVGDDLAHDGRALRCRVRAVSGHAGCVVAGGRGDEGGVDVAHDEAGAGAALLFDPPVDFGDPEILGARCASLWGDGDRDDSAARVGDPVVDGGEVGGDGGEVDEAGGVVGATEDQVPSGGAVGEVGVQPIEHLGCGVAGDTGLGDEPEAVAEADQSPHPISLGVAAVEGGTGCGAEVGDGVTQDTESVDGGSGGGEVPHDGQVSHRGHAVAEDQLCGLAGVEDDRRLARGKDRVGGVALGRGAATQRDGQGCGVEVAAVDLGQKLGVGASLRVDVKRHGSCSDRESAVEVVDDAGAVESEGAVEVVDDSK